MKDYEVDITGIDKAKLLMELYNNADLQGMGYLIGITKSRFIMTKEQADELVASGNLDFDYLQGRSMKINLSGNIINATLYNRDNGWYPVQETVAKLRAEQRELEKSQPSKKTTSDGESKNQSLPVDADKNDHDHSSDQSEVLGEQNPDNVDLTM